MAVIIYLETACLPNIISHQLLFSNIPHEISMTDLKIYNILIIAQKRRFMKNISDQIGKQKLAKIEMIAENHVLYA